MEITSKTNIDEIQAELERLRAKGYGMAPLFEEIANHLYNLADEAFDDETSPDGDVWLPLSSLICGHTGSNALIYLRSLNPLSQCLRCTAYFTGHRLRRSVSRMDVLVH